MAKVKTEDSRVEKVKVNVGRKAVDTPEGYSGVVKTGQNKPETWKYPEMDGGFAEEMQHSPGETVHPVDLSVPEAVQTGKETDVDERPSQAPVTSPEGVGATETGKEEGTVTPPESKGTNQPDAVYADDEDFYSSKLNSEHTDKKRSQTHRTTLHSGKYLNIRFVFIVLLFIVTVVSGLVMLVIIEQQHPGSGMIFEYLPLP